ncbi:MAG: GAF domain-containing protein [bacterium]
MERPVVWKVALVSPGESEVALLADLSHRRDAIITGVIDPAGDSVGGAIAELMGLPIFKDFNSPDLVPTDYLVYPLGLEGVAELVKTAENAGFVTMSSRDFRRWLSPAPLSRVISPRVSRDFEHLERETESIHRTLSRIEEVLQRESLLRWLLSLATRAVDATSGSIMLFDEKSAELYVAFAYGLSEATLHSTRISLGEGIAGRVAQQLRAELVTGRDASDGHRDRPDIVAAISAPLVWEDRLLGVLNINVGAGDQRLDRDDLTTSERLAQRLSLILDRFLGLQRAQASELYRDTEAQLVKAMQDVDSFEETVTAWADILAPHLAADGMSLSVVCDDGSLLVAEKTLNAAATSRHELPENPAWRDVQQSGSPLVVRQCENAENTEGGLTVFYLPIGKDPCLAVLTLAFTSAADSHRFHEIAGEIIYLLERRLVELISKLIQHDRLERLTALTTAMAEIVSYPETARRAVWQRIIATSQRLTGARQVYLVTAETDGEFQFVGSEGSTEPAWRGESERLLTEAMGDGWYVTLLSHTTDPHPEEQCLLAATASSETPLPGLLLYGKKRRHPLDGVVFTDFDGQIAHRLAQLITTCPVATETVADTDAAPEAAPIPAELVETTPVPVPLSPETPLAAPSSPLLAQREVLLHTIRREMDRCDRYHTAFALTAFCAAAPHEWNEQLVQLLVEQLGGQVRSSDFLTCTPDGVVLMIAPEDVQSVSRLQRRLMENLQDLASTPAGQVLSAYNVYPGRYDDAAALLNATLTSLRAEP